VNADPKPDARGATRAGASPSREFLTAMLTLARRSGIKGSKLESQPVLPAKAGIQALSASSGPTSPRLAGVT